MDLAIEAATDLHPLKPLPKRAHAQLVCGSGNLNGVAVIVLVTEVPQAQYQYSPSQQLESFKSTLRRKYERDSYQAVAEKTCKIGPYEGTLLDFYHTWLFSRMHTRIIIVRRGNQYFTVVYLGKDIMDNQLYDTGAAIVNSFKFRSPAHPIYAYTETACDSKIYGIPHKDSEGKEDMRSLHEFPDGIISPSNAVLHRKVLPFEAVAMTKGFDNNIYAVTKAVSNQPEYVYCYQPATGRGEYTPWQLPAQGKEFGWISGGTDSRGDLYFITYDASLFVHIEPRTGTVSPVWTSTPMPLRDYNDGAFYSAVNFCFDTKDILHLIHSVKGEVLRYDIVHNKLLMPLVFDIPGPSGGYGNNSDVLLQRDAQGQLVLYASGAGKTFSFNLQTRQTALLMEQFYTELAGCNIFRPMSPVAAPALWRGRILDDSTHQPLPQAQLLPAAPTPPIVVDATANFAWSAYPDRKYTYEVRQPGYYAASGTWVVAAPGRQQDILLKKIRVGITILLEKVQFQQGKTVMLPGAETALQKLLVLLKEHPAMTIELAGHTDNVGDAKKNLVLSENRVAAVKAYLVRQGIAATRIVGRGYGGSRPKASNDQEETRRLNRRVEFTITGFN